AFVGGAVIYGVIKKMVGIRMGQEEEFDGADLSIHKIVSSTDD
ncbi:MAG: ammonium transporter, partial [Betaproteobacteria bacterium HGW-Betaproteobacteria-20]